MRRADESAGYRHERIQGLIFEELSALVRDELGDPAFASVRIAAVVLSVDYRAARVHFVLTSALEERHAVERAFVRVAPFLRARLAEAIELKRVPDLRFVFDGVARADGGSQCSE